METETTNAVQLSERLGVRLDTLYRRWKWRLDVPFDRTRPLSDSEIETLSVGMVGAGSKAKARKESDAEAVAEGLAVTAEVNRLTLEQIQSAPAESESKPFDYRVFAARTGLWLITAAQIGLVMYGCFARFGTVGLIVAAIPSVFLVVVNITATDARFWGTTDTGFWVSVALAVVFGTLHFFTFRDLLDLGGNGAFWFCAVSATVVECVALAALSLQSKISNEQ